MDWSEILPPSLDDLTDIAEESFAKLPDELRALVQEVTIRVQDFPDEEVMKGLECETEYDLLGLFTGVAITDRSEMEISGLMPNMIFLYRRPILDYWAENDGTLGEVITHVLVHEIGHHFGLSDEDMERLEQQTE